MAPAVLAPPIQPRSGANIGELTKASPITVPTAVADHTASERVVGSFAVPLRMLKAFSSAVVSIILCVAAGRSAATPLTIFPSLPESVDSMLGNSLSVTSTPRVSSSAPSWSIFACAARST